MGHEGRPVSFWRLLRLLIGLRFAIAWRRESRLLGALPGALFGLLLATALAFSGGRLLELSAHSPAPATWLPFSLTLLVFLTGLFWALWPVLAARVDEAYELDRYLAYPLRPARLYLAHTLLGFFEPTALLFYPLLGALLVTLWRLGELPTGVAATTTVALLCLSYVAMNVAIGRALLNLLLGVLASRRSTEWLMLATLGMLTLAMLLPPVDASWLFSRFGTFGAQAQDLAFLQRSTAAMAQTPAGLLASGLGAVALGHSRDALLYAASMATCGLVAWLVGLVALLRFHRGGGAFAARWAKRPRPAKNKRPRPSWLGGGVVIATATKELRQLSRLPKVQLLFFVPLFLAILLKIVGGPQLLSYLWGAQWAAMLSFLLGLYALSVWSGPLLSNAFGYDGDGIITVLACPAGLEKTLLGKNIAHALLLSLQQLLLALFVFTLPGARLEGLLLPLCGLCTALFASLGVGALLSLRAPRRLHPTLGRRDRPVAASLAMMLALLAGVGASALFARSAGYLALAALPLAGLGIYLLSHRTAARLGGPLRERLLMQIRAR